MNGLIIAMIIFIFGTPFLFALPRGDPMTISIAVPV
jgi:hypothetical protein